MPEKRAKGQTPSKKRSKQHGFGTSGSRFGTSHRFGVSVLISESVSLEIDSGYDSIHGSSRPVCVDAV